MALQQFNKNTNISSLIKGILNQTPLPTIKTIVMDDFIVRGFYYIDKNDLLYCTNTGRYGYTAECIKVCNYNFGTYYPQFTEKFLSKTNYYDSETHEWLGRYLRCIRDIFEVNLMPLYNCFSNSFTDRFVIKYDHIVETNNKDYKIAKIPIKFDIDYTIAMECDSTVFIAPVFLVKNNLLHVNFEGNTLQDRYGSYEYGKLESTDMSELLWKKGNPIQTRLGTRFKQPFLFRVDSIPIDERGNFKMYEDDLYMLIQIPKNNKSSIVVLEGDYTDCGSKKVFHYPELHNFNREEMDKICNSNLSLLALNDGINRPFSDKLIEYLLLNVITNAERIDKNIKRVQDLINNAYSGKAEYGTWTNELRYDIYKKIINDKNSNGLDIFGYVDKNGERILYRGE